MKVKGETYVLIPGAWHAGWSWRPVAERLRAARHRAITLTLPGLGDGDDPTGWRLQDAVDHVVRLIRDQQLGRVTLVGHSWGGYPMTGAAYELRSQVSEVIYYNAMVPLRGLSMVDDNPPDEATAIRESIETSPNRVLYPDPDFVRRVLMPGVAEETQRLVVELLTPQPGDYFLDTLDVPNVAELGIPARYVLGENDHGIGEFGFAARIGTTPIMVPGTHEGLLTHPDDVATTILGVAPRPGPSDPHRTVGPHRQRSDGSSADQPAAASGYG